MMSLQRFALFELRLMLRASCSKYSPLRRSSCIRQLQRSSSTSAVHSSGCVAKQAWTSAGVRWLPAATKAAIPLDTKPAMKKTEITYEELTKLVDTGTLHLYDVREPADVNETGIIKSAINIPLTKLKASLLLDPEQFATQFCAVKPAKDGQNVIFYGFSSVKSTAAVEIAHKLGFKKARYFPGGWEEWSKSPKKV